MFLKRKKISIKYRVPTSSDKMQTSTELKCEAARTLRTRSLVLFYKKQLVRKLSTHLEL